jgi:hypothetical protein
MLQNQLTGLPPINPFQVDMRKGRLDRNKFAKLNTFAGMGLMDPPPGQIVI